MSNKTTLQQSFPFMAIMLGLSFVFSSCAFEESRPATRENMLHDLSSVVILPSFEDFSASASMLTLAAETFQTSPSLTTLSACQGAWRNARQSWGHCEAFLFGPPADLFIDSHINLFPIDDTKIEATIAGADPIDADAIAAFGDDSKGFLAAEYLLFDASGDNTLIVDAMTTGANAARRLAYLVAVTQRIQARAEQMEDIWSPSGDDYAASFARAGSDSTEYAQVSDAIDDVVNRLILFAEVIADVRLGAPLGLTFQGIAQPNQAEASLSGNSIADILADVQGIRNLYFCEYSGTKGVGLHHIIRHDADFLDDAIVDALDQFESDVRAIPGTLADAVITHPNLVTQAFNSAKILKVRFTVDLVSAFSSTLKFSPFDGD